MTINPQNLTDVGMIQGDNDLGFTLESARLNCALETLITTARFKCASWASVRPAPGEQARKAPGGICDLLDSEDNKLTAANGLALG